jgi:RHS repeat-associated protein
MAHPTSASNAVQLNHDLIGNVTSITYPDGRTLSQQFDSDDRLAKVQDASWNANATYWSNPSYYPAGGLARAKFGNGIQMAAGFNNRGSMTSLSYATSTGTSLWGRSYVWAGNAMNLTKSTDLTTGVSTTYAYDNLNRLTSANQPTACSVTGFQESYTLDAWGNLKQSGNFSFMPSGYTSNNQVADTGYVYDSAGNMTSELIPGFGSRTYQYDALNQLTGNAAGATYTYDAEGNRIRKVSGSSVTEYVWVGGQLLATYDPNANAWQDLIYAGGQFVAEIGGTQNAVPNYRLSDQLGSLVMLTNNSGSAIGTYSYTPYGELLSSSGTGDAYMFSGLEWDSEINSYHAQYRQMMGVEGRWLTTDPYRGSYDWGDPQSLNRYAYVNGRAMWATDRSGLDGDPFTVVMMGYCTHTFGVGCFSPGAVIGVVAAAVVGVLAEITHGFGLWGKPAFHGSLKPRPNAHDDGCNLVTPASTSSQAIHYKVAADAVGYFQPSFASQVANGIATLNAQGIVPMITSGFRTPGTQLSLRMGGSGTNPAAITSWHQQGLAADFGLNSNNPYNVQVQNAMHQQGMTWGGNWSGNQYDPVHFQQPPSGSRSPGQLKPNCPTPKGGTF